MNRTVCIAACIPAFFVVLPVSADESELVALKRQIQQLTERYEAQQAATTALEIRLRRQELQANMTSSERRDQGDSNLRNPQNQVARSTDTQVAQAEPQDRVISPTDTSNSGDGLRQMPKSQSAQAVYQGQSGGIFGDPRKFTFETALTYSHYNARQLTLNGFLALDAIFLGNINVDRVRADILTLDLTGRYALSDRAQIDLGVPVIYRRTAYESAGAGFSTNGLSEVIRTRSPHIGDVSAGFYYKLVQESRSTPDLVWNVRLKAPTGTHPYGIKIIDAPSNSSLKTPAELPTGNGVWTLSSGFSIIKTVDPAILFANLSYFHNFGRHFADISSIVGERQPGKVKLGDAIQWGIGTAFALSERSSVSFSFSQLLSTRASTQLDGGTKSRLVGTNANAASFNVGLTHSLSDRATMVTHLGIGLTPDAPNFTFGVTFPYSF